MSALVADPRALWLAVPAMIGVAVGAITAANSSIELGKLKGMDAMAADTERVYVASGRRIYALDHAGRLQTLASLEELGISGPVVDMAPASDALYVADGATQRVLRCALAEQRCIPALMREGRDEHLASFTMRVLHAPSGETYVGNSNSDSIDVYGMDGRHRMSTRDLGIELRMPMGMQWAEGHLVVADSNSHRIVALDPSRDFATAWSFDTRNDLVRGSLRRPVELARARDGLWWVVLANNMVSRAAVVIFSPSGRTLNRVELAPSDNPSALAAAGNFMLIADYTKLDVQRVSLEGQVLASFGDETFHAWLDEERVYKKSVENTRNLAWGSVIVGVALLLLAGIIDQRARGQRPASTPTRRVGHVAPVPAHASMMRPLSADEIRWIAPRKLFARLPLVVAAVSIVPVAMLVPLREDLGNELLLMFIGMEVVLLATAILSSRMLANLRIGVAGTRLYLVDFMGRRADADAAEVLYSERRLVIGKVRVPYRNGHAGIFPEDMVATHVQPILLPGNKRSEWGLMTSQDKIVFAIGVAAVLAIVALRYSGLVAGD